MAQKTWLDDSPYDLLERNLKRLGATMLISAIYDVLLGLSSLFFPSRILRLVGLPVPQDVFYFSFWSMVHLVFACFCILAWMDIKRNIVIVTGAIVARVLYAALMFVSVFVFDVGRVWAIAGGISLVLAIVHYLLLRLSDFGFWEVISRAGNPPGVRKN